MTKHSKEILLAAFEGDDFEIIGLDSNVDSQNNMICFGFDDLYAFIGTIEGLEIFITDVAEFYARKLHGQKKPCIVYAWVDEMAGNLRFSAVKQEGLNKLPFECEIEPTTSAQDFASEVWAIVMLSRSDSIDQIDSTYDGQEFKLSVFLQTLD